MSTVKATNFQHPSAASPAIVLDAAGGVVSNLVPQGTVMYFAMSTAPSGWLKANGAQVSRTTYAALFAAIGTTFGVGDGSTTFTLPDLRGEFLRGWADGRAVDTGRAFGSAQVDQFALHHHTIPTHSVGGVGDYQVNSSGYSRANSTGGAGGDETRPRNIALLACIRY